jgi:hypothetical protein
LTRPLLSAVLLSLTACTDLGPEYESNFSPMPGTWDNTEISIEKNSCGLDFEKMEPLNFSLNPVDASSFLLQSVDAEVFWECASSGSEMYACTSYVVTYPFEGIDAVLNYVYAPGLQFYSEVSATMLLDLTNDCVGVDCSSIEDSRGMKLAFPCLTELNLTLEHTGS